MNSLRKIGSCILSNKYGTPVVTYQDVKCDMCNYMPRCEQKGDIVYNIINIIKLIHRPEEGLDLKSGAYWLVPCMHLPKVRVQSSILGSASSFFVARLKDLLVGFGKAKFIPFDLGCNFFTSCITVYGSLSLHTIVDM